jgi:hypothetical protein
VRSRIEVLVRTMLEGRARQSQPVANRRRIDGTLVRGYPVRATRIPRSSLKCPAH